MNNAELFHTGVKGMKWGVRRYQNKDGSLTPLGKKRYAKELAKLEAEKKRVRQQEQTAKKLKKLDDMRKDLDERKKALKPDDAPESAKQQKAQPAPQKRKLSELSNEEIQAKIDRMNLENRYRELANTPITNVPKKEVSKGQRFVMEVLEKSGKNIATQASAYVIGVGANKLLEQIAGDKNAIDPKNIQKIKK